MNCIITMAGRGQRFREQGYNIPKYEIVANGGTLFEWSLSSLVPWAKRNWKFVFVTLKENNAKNFISSKIDSLGIKEFACVEIDEVTDGQATTVLRAQPAIKDQSQPLVIFNVDTHIKPQSLASLADLKLFAPCFEVPGDHWSFFARGDDGFATQAAEKRRISPWASVGLYGFDSFNQFENAYRQTYENAKVHNLLKERYVAPLYNEIIQGGGQVAVPILQKEDVIAIGTPGELDLLVQSGIAYREPQ